MMTLQTCFQAKSTLGFSPSTCIDEITDEKLHTKFTQKLVEVSLLENIVNFILHIFIYSLMTCLKRVNTFIITFLSTRLPFL